jgi:phosphoglycolate phosphatase
MKPDPHLIERATSTLGVAPASCVFIGDQPTDVEAGQAARVTTIGYANKPGKVEPLSGAGADVILTSLLDLAEALY